MTVDKIYESIAQEINNSINDNWETAVLNIEFEGEGVVGYNGDYKIDAEKKDIDVFEISFEISDWITELHEITTEGGNNKWNRAIFTLFPTGKFDMEFIWDQELNDEIERLSKE
jgi:hypothetical protein